MMALGNFRGAGKAENKRIEDRLAQHFHLMSRFVCQGMERDEASKKAYKIVAGQEEQ